MPTQRPARLSFTRRLLPFADRAKGFGQLQRLFRLGNQRFCEQFVEVSCSAQPIN
jgi:hypothetical protein